ncbi:MAG TPA: hypothetical protein EYP85_07875 [Armatimonadetes bacterium]|nr:hypothetical protein [Armatimonadota bacterium]
MKRKLYRLCSMLSGALTLGLLTLPLPIWAGVQNSREWAYRFLDEECGSSFSVRGELRVANGWAAGAEARLAFNWQDQAHYYCLYLRQGKAGFSKVREGQIQPLGPTVALPPLPPEGTLSFTLQRRPGKIRLICGGETLLKVEEGEFTRGRLGVAVSSSDLQWAGVLYQPVEPIYFADDFMRSSRYAGDWEEVFGFWKVKGPAATWTPRVGAPANPFAYEGQGDREGKALTTVGYWFWDDYSLQAAVRPRREGAVGLCAYVQDAANYFLFRWTAGLGPQGKRQLVKVKGGREIVLAEEAGGYEPQQWYTLRLQGVEGNWRAFIDGHLALSAQDSAFGQGKAGLYVEGSRADFDDVVVESVTEGGEARREMPSPPPIAEAFIRDRLMRQWATEVGWWEWTPTGFWHQGDFFADPCLRLPLPVQWPLQGTIRAVIGAAEPAEDRGYRLECKLAANRLQVQLWREGQLVAEVEKSPSEVPRPATLVLRQRGAEVLVEVNEERVLTFRDQWPLRGRKVGFQTEGWPLDPAKALALSPNACDWAFATAPVEFRAQRGKWELLQRWHCWGRSHFGGSGSFSPLLWTKQDFEGDLTLFFYAASGPRISSLRQQPGMRDLNVTICGDGLNVGSGYSFVVGGWDGTRSAIFRRGEKVAQSKVVPSSRSPGTAWCAIKVQKEDGHLALYVDNVLAAEYTDPEPLPGGKVAFWTVNGRSLVLGRVRLWYERTGPWEPFPAPLLTSVEALEEGKPSPTEAPELPGNNDFEVTLGTWTTQGRLGGTRLRLDSSTASQGKRSLRVENAASGGPFSVWIVREPVSLVQRPRLRFAYKVPPEVKVNFYARVAREWYEITFTGEVERPNRKILGRIPEVRADNQWHEAEFDLLAALQKLRPGAEEWVVDELALASPNEPYLRAGLTGNPYGAVYHLDDFALGR